MSVINGRFVGLNDREFILRTGGEIQGGGRIHAVDPTAVAHFKAVLAQQQAEPTRPRRPSPGIRRGGNGRLDAD